jgi:hypothetical protein
MAAIDLIRHRLHSHRITHTAFTEPAQVVAWFGAMQAQDYPHSKWAVGLRCDGAADADVERAIADRTIVRTWAMRGTLQLVAADDVRWLLSLVGPRIIARGAADDLRRFGLDEAEFTRIDTLLDKILHGRQLTRKETYAALEKHGIRTEGQRGYHILARAGLKGKTCFGEWQGKAETFALLDEWLSSAPSPSLSPLGRGDKPKRDATSAELALRYFRSHGPATLGDFVWWSSLTVAEARAGLTGAQPNLIEEKVSDTTYWLADGAAPAKVKSPNAKSTFSVHLLPGFDEYLLGYTDRSLILQKVHNASVIHSNGIFKPTVVVDGQIVGTWGRRVVKGKVVVTPTTFAPMTAREQRAVEEATERYEAYLESND